jgi:NhaA family Na+:H+ antiporter
MTAFLFWVGLELKESWQRSGPALFSLVGLAALGGMLLPGALYLLVSPKEPRGFGVPMVTDVALSLGALSWLAPQSALRPLLGGLGVLDDLGGLFLLAFFYGHGLHPFWLIGLFLLLGIGFWLGHLPWTLGPLGLGCWLLLERAGFQPALSGALVASLVPSTLLASWRTRLTPWIESLVVPLFLLAQGGFPLRGVGLGRVGLGILLGLWLGKPLGILLASGLALRLGWGAWPSTLSLREGIAGACLGGIGLTVSLYLAASLWQGTLLDQARLGLLLGSLLSFGTAWVIVRWNGFKVL